MRKAETLIATPLLRLHGNDDGCIVPPTDEDRRLFDARVLEVVPNLGHFLQVEAPTTIAARVARWLVALRARGARGRARTCLTSRDEHCSPFRGEF
jgi:pimeloyl-ACP methyl ester carboxylesterase